MSLIAIARPSTESETAFICCLLRAHEIPYFVRGGGMAGLFPGLQIGGYNTRAVLVPGTVADIAAEVLADARQANVDAPADRTTANPAVSVLDPLRLVLETLLFGWFVPRSGPERTRDDNDEA